MSDFKPLSPLRRRLVQSAAAGAALAGVAPLIRAQGSKPFAGRTLRLFIYSGAWEKAINTQFTPRFEELTGAKVVPDPGWWDSIPKLKASPPGQPAFDLVLTDATQGHPAIREGLFQKLDRRLLPNVAGIAPAALKSWVYDEGYGVTFPDSQMMLVYNKELVGAAPKGWGDLMRDDLRGKIGLYNSFYMSLYTFAAMKVAADGKPGTASKEMADNLAGVVRFAREQRERVKYWWPTSTDMGLNLSQKNVAVGNLHSNGLLTLMKQKPEIATVWNDPERVSVQLMWVVPAGTRERELAHAALNQLIGAEMQEALAKNGNNTAVPAVAAKIAASDPAWGSLYPSTPERIANIRYYPYDAYFKDWDNLVATWDREVLRKKA